MICTSKGFDTTLYLRICTSVVCYMLWFDDLMTGEPTNVLFICSEVTIQYLYLVFSVRKAQDVVLLT